MSAAVGDEAISKTQPLIAPQDHVNMDKARLEANFLSPLRLEVHKKNAGRVKSVDLLDSWVLLSMTGGNVQIFDCNDKKCIHSFDISKQPVRCVKFIPQNSWFVAGSDDGHLRILDYNTNENVADFEAHSDFIRSVEIHPTLPYILSASDDKTIKLWDMDNNFECKKQFMGHSYYVMQVKINPIDTNTFASASFDTTIKVWSIDLKDTTPDFTLDGHERGVTSVDYYPSSDKPHLISGGDDFTVNIWNYKTQSLLKSLKPSPFNVNAVIYHPKLPFLVSASDDAVRIWHGDKVKSFKFDKGRAWALAVSPTDNKLAIGLDGGCVCLEMEEELETMTDNHSIIDWDTTNGTITQPDEVTSATTKLLLVRHLEDAICFHRLNFCASSFLYHYYVNAIRRISWNPDTNYVFVLIDAYGGWDLRTGSTTEIYRNGNPIPKFSFRTLYGAAGRHVCVLSYREEDFFGRLLTAAPDEDAHSGSFTRVITFSYIYNGSIFGISDYPEVTFWTFPLTDMTADLFVPSDEPHCTLEDPSAAYVYDRGSNDITKWKQCKDGNSVIPSTILDQRRRGEWGGPPPTVYK